jgi:hypothetical protein
MSSSLLRMSSLLVWSVVAFTVECHRAYCECHRVY